MKIHDKTVKVDTLKLKVDKTLNVREDYDIGSLQEQIRAAGRVLEPIWYEKESMRVLKGNRRTLAAQGLLADNDTPEALKKNLAELNAIAVEDLSDKERTELVFDQGTQKSLNRSEIINAVWRLHAQMYEFMDIARLFYQSIALFTGNTKKALQLQGISMAKDRDKFLHTWLKGTLDDYLLTAAKLGSRVKRQVLLYEIRQERQLTEAEVAEVKFDCDRSKVKALRTAQSEDKSAGKWDSKLESGPKFEEKWNQFVQEAKTGSTKKNTRPSVTDLEDRATNAKNDYLKGLLLYAAGKKPENFSLENADAEITRIDLILETLKTATPKNAKVGKLIKSICFGDHQQVAENLKDL